MRDLPERICQNLPDLFPHKNAAAAHLTNVWNWKFWPNFFVPFKVSDESVFYAMAVIVVAMVVSSRIELKVAQWHPCPERFGDLS